MRFIHLFFLNYFVLTYFSFAFAEGIIIRPLELSSGECQNFCSELEFELTVDLLVQSPPLREFDQKSTPGFVVYEVLEVQRFSLGKIARQEKKTFKDSFEIDGEKLAEKILWGKMGVRNRLGEYAQNVGKDCQGCTVSLIFGLEEVGGLDESLAKKKITWASIGITESMITIADSPNAALGTPSYLQRDYSWAQVKFSVKKRAEHDE